MKKLNRQHGGTIVGIIIGLILGLGIALAVALTITKSGSPFAGKLLRPEKVSEGKAQSGDPNKPLYGNKAPAPPKDFIKEVEKTMPPPPPQPADRRNAGKIEAPKELPPMAAIEPAKKPGAVDGAAEAKSAAKDAGGKDDNKWQYFLQAGAFREQKDAEATRAKLALLGVEAQITERQSENGTLYRVRIGPFAQLEPMTRVRGKLSDNGMDAAVVRTSR